MSALNIAQEIIFSNGSLVIQRPNSSDTHLDSSFFIVGSSMENEDQIKI